MTDPNLPNGNDIPPFTIAAHTQQKPPSLDDLAAILAKADGFTMRRRPPTDHLRYIAQQILEYATWRADSHLYEIAVTLRGAADEVEKEPAGPTQPSPDLRDAVAHAFTTCLKATAPITGFSGTIGIYGGVTPHELADLGLDVIRPHMAVPIEADATVLAAVGEKLATARVTSCGHGVHAPRCDACSPTEVALRTELAATYWELLQAITHDRQPYPTPWAYEQACKAREKQRKRADAAEEEVKRLLAVLDQPGPATADVLHPDTEQPVNDPQPVDESRADTDRVVHARRPMTGAAGVHVAEVMRAVRPRYAAEHPDTEGTTP